jgi:hypothetical protein
MEQGKQQKTISLTADTVAMVAKKGKDWNFSGWIRARIRQMDEGVDPVQLDLMFSQSKLQYKTLAAAINYTVSKDIVQDIYDRYNLMLNQRRLEDFE